MATIEVHILLLILRIMKVVTETKFLLFGIKRAVIGVTLLSKKAVGVSEHGVGA